MFQIDVDTKPQEEPVDLLNLNSLNINSTAQKSPSSNFDLLSGLGGEDTFNDFVMHGDAPKDLFDPFGTSSTNQPSNLLPEWTKAQKPNDLLGGWSQSASASPQTTAHTTPQHVPFAPTSPQHHAPSTTPQQIPTTPQHAPPFVPTQPTAQARSPENRPDYSRSHFDTVFTSNKNDNGKAKAKPADVFGDLLGSQGYQFSAKKDNSPRTINEMRKEEMAKDMDPEKLKVMEWVSYDFLPL